MNPSRDITLPYLTPLLSMHIWTVTCNTADKHQNIRFDCADQPAFTVTFNAVLKTVTECIAFSGLATGPSPKEENHVLASELPKIVTLLQEHSGTSSHCNAVFKRLMTFSSVHLSE